MADIKIWYKDINNFINKDNFNIFFPTETMNYEEKLNAIMRLTLYTMILFYLITQKLKLTLTIILFVMIIIVVMYEIYLEQKKKQLLKDYKNNSIILNNKKCIKPTKDNPFMNVLPGENLDKKNDKNSELANYYSACDITNEKIEKNIKSTFERDLYRNSEDIYGKKGGVQRFVNVPNEVSLNHQKKYAEWLYGDFKKTNKTMVW